MAADIHLLDLVGREKLDRILKGFTEVAGVGSIISDANGKPITRPHHFTDLCLKYCRSTEEGRHRCYVSDRYGGRESLRTGKPPIYNCLNAGLMDCAAPIIVEGRHLATVLCGQVLDEPFSRKMGLHRARQIGIKDIDGYLHALEQVPLMERERLLNIANLMAVITQTISELALRKYLQEKHSEHYLNKLINSVSDCIISTNVEGVISIINDAGAKMFGYGCEELIGRSIIDLFGDENSKKSYIDRLEDRPKGDCRMEINAMRADRRLFPAQVSIARTNKNDTQSLDFVTVIRDISDQKKIERMKEDLIAMVAHDIKNPILSMQKALEVLINEGIGPLNEVQSEITQLALDTSHQLFGMISNLLDIYRKENGQFVLDKKALDIHEVICESVKHTTLLARDRKVRLTIAVHPEMLHIEADWNRLRRTCINLIENAINHSPEYGEVLISARPIDVNECELWREVPQNSLGQASWAGEEFVLIAVDDQGVGVPEEYHYAVFEKFFTIDNGGDRIRKSLGLGLTFCKQVIEAHGGAIWLKSPLFVDETSTMRGCRFQFVLPVGGI